MFPIIPRFKNMKIMNKMVLAFLLVVFIPTVFAGAYLTFRFRQTALDNAAAETANSVQRVLKLTADSLKVPNDISSYLLFDRGLEDVVNTWYDSTLDVVKAYNNYDNIRQYEQMFSSQIANIRVYVDNPTLIANWVYIQPEESIRNTHWYQGAMDAIRYSLWYYIPDETKSNEKYLSLIRRIRFTSYNTNGILVISLNRDYLSSLLSQEPFKVFVADDKDYIVATNESGYIGKSLNDSSFTSFVSGKGAGTYEKVIDGTSYKIIVKKIVPESSTNGLRIISFFSIDKIVTQSNRILIEGLIITLLSALASGFLIYIVSFLLSNRIMKLSRHIRLVTRGDLDTKFVISGNDEAGQLSAQFNSMVESIKRLLNEVKESNTQKNQLQLKQNELRLNLMANQINPHFLFNALESIRLKALLNGEKDVAQIIKVLGKLMRKKLEIYKKDILLKNELEMIRCYLEIEKYRYDDRLTYEISVDPEAEEVKVPALIIQPLVENAVHYGLASIDGKGVVIVEAHLINGELYVEVTDHGIGMNEEKLEEVTGLLNDADDHEGDHIGLHNVNMRLRFSYGERYGLKIDSKLNEGTKVSFSIPAGGAANVQGAGG